MAKYEVLSGKHVHTDGRRYVKGDTIVTALPLDELFKNKFRPVGVSGSVTASPATSASKQPTVPEPSPVAQEKAKSDPTSRGADVSADYPEALACGFKVYRRGRWFHVYDGAAITPANDSALRKEDVPGFLARLLEA